MGFKLLLRVVHRLAYNDDVAADQGVERSAHIWRDTGRARNAGKTARRVALKMGWRPPCSSIASRTIFMQAGREPNSRSIKMVPDAPSTANPSSDRLVSGHPLKRNESSLYARRCNL